MITSVRSSMSQSQITEKLNPWHQGEQTLEQTEDTHPNIKASQSAPLMIVKLERTNRTTLNGDITLYLGSTISDHDINNQITYNAVFSMSAFFCDSIQHPPSSLFNVLQLKDHDLRCNIPSFPRYNENSNY